LQVVVVSNADEDGDGGGGSSCDVPAATTEPHLSDVGGLRHQLSTLASSLSTVTKQKSRLEATYIAEKKKLKVMLSCRIICNLCNYFGHKLSSGVLYCSQQGC